MFTFGSGIILSAPDRWAAENTPQGIFVANGPSYQVRGEIDPIKIIDITSTVLACFGCDVPTDMSGSVLSIFEDNPSWDCREPIDIAVTSTADRLDEVAERLSDFGIYGMKIVLRTQSDFRTR